MNALALPAGFAFNISNRNDGRVAYFVTGPNEFFEAGSETTISKAAESVARAIEERTK